MEFLCALVAAVTVIGVVSGCFVFKEYKNVKKQIVRHMLDIEEILNEILGDLEINQSKLEEFINSRKSGGDSQMNNLRKAFTHPPKVHERSGTE